MKRTVFQLLKVLVSAGLITFLVWKISPEKLIPQLRGMDPPWLVAALVVFAASSVLGALQWHLLLGAGGVRISAGRTVRLYFTGLFFNNFLPTNVGGDAVKIFDVARDGNDPHRVFAITLLDRIIGIGALCLLALIASAVLLPSGVVDNLSLYVLIFAGCLAPVLLLALNRRLSRFVRTLMRRVNVWRIGERLDTVLNHLGSFRTFRALMLKLILLAMAVQFLRVATHLLVGRALGVEMTGVRFASFYVFIPLLGLIMMLPVSINGLGVREGTGILLFTTVGFSGEQALLLEFITYAVMVTVSLVGGVFFLGRHLGRG